MSGENNGKKRIIVSDSEGLNNIIQKMTFMNLVYLRGWE
jgi:hypothetical protein